MGRTPDDTTEGTTGGARERTVRLRVRRQDGPKTRPYWEGFEVPYQPNMNVISCLMAIRKHPVNARGKKTTPVVWESNCLEEICGACSMNINGRARQACSALVDQLRQPIILEPFAAFPVVRDLVVDREIMFEHLKQVKAWIPIDGTHDLGPGPRYTEEEQQLRYELSKCMTCGVCLEVCPNFQADGRFIGAQPLGQVLFQNMHPTGNMNRQERLEGIMGSNGITNCGNAQNCVQMCPKGIPLTDAIAILNGETMRHALRRWFRR